MLSAMTTRRSSVLRSLGLSRAVVPGEASGRIGLALVAIGLVVFFSLRTANFFTTTNGLTIALTMTSILIVVVGSGALMIAGNVDLSIGSMYTLVAVTVGYVAAETQSTLLAVVVGPLLGLALGLLNGVLVRLLKISPLIVTLGTLSIYGGAAFVVSDGVPVYGFPQSFLDVGRSGFGDLTIPIITAAVVFLVGGFWLVRTRVGLHVYAIGGDARAAALNGVPVGRTVVGLYGLNGFLVGVASVLLAARLGTVSPQFGSQFVFDVLTAAILGGVAFAGGSGRPMGIFIGVATIGILNAGLLFEGLEDYWVQIAKGGVLLLALAADQLLQSVREAGGWRQWLARLLGDVAPAEPNESRARGESRAATPARIPRLARAAVRGDASVVLEAEGLTCQFGAVRALANASLRVHAGEVVCLLGDNGAGKSTLIKILAGAVHADAGTVRLDGAPVELRTPRDARAAGIETVYQDLALCPPLSVAHNMVLGDEPVRRMLGVVPVRDEAAAHARAARRPADLGIELADYDLPVQRLSGGQRQAVAIARAVHDGVRVMILDEPTAALGVHQTRTVLELIGKVADRGTGVILITHDVETVLAVADRVVVLRLGTVVHDGPVGELDELSLIRLMAGLAIEPSATRNGAATKPAGAPLAPEETAWGTTRA